MREGHSPGARTWRLAALFFAFGLSAALIFRIAWIAFRYGENNLSNDFLSWVSTIASILDGNYKWRNLFRDTFVTSGHCSVVTVLFHTLAAKLADLNLDVETAFALVLTALRLALFFLALTGPLQGPKPHAPQPAAPFPWLALPLFTSLVFSTSQISTFTNPDNGVEIALAQLGIAVATVAIARSRSDLRAAAWASAGGLFASWSWGGGVMIWPALALGLVLRHGLRLRSLALLVVSGCTAATPYALYITVGKKGTAGPPSFGNIPFFLDTLGRPFVDDTATSFVPRLSAQLLAIAGLVAFAAVVLRLLKRSQTAERRTAVLAPALVLATWSLLCVAQISLFRREVAPWYVPPAVPFWIALSGLAVVLAVPREGHDGTRILPRPRDRALGLSVLTFVTALSLRSNLTWEDKSFYLPARSPASAACLREHRTAPTYCENHVFQWGDGNPETLGLLANGIERHRLSVFARRQTWTAQGDTVLGRVSNAPGLLGSQPRWGDGLDPTPRPFSDFRRLNAFVPAGGALTWTVPLPADAERLRFRTRVAWIGGSSTGGIAEVAVRPLSAPAGEKVEAVVTTPMRPGWTPVETGLHNLNGLRGKTVAIEMRWRVDNASLNSVTAGTWLVFEKPLLVVRQAREQAPKPPTAWSPPNVGAVTTSSEPPSATSADLELGSSNWQLDSLTRGSGSEDFRVAGRRPSLLRRGLSIPMNQAKQLSITVGAKPSIKPRSVRFTLVLDEDIAIGRTRHFSIPLVEDGNPHKYRYNLALLQLFPESRLTAIEVAPVVGARRLEPDERGLVLRDLKID